ncbi:MAG: hypothetical protein ABSE08_10720, partial [Syntrophobacteraceae bacterium]
TESTELHLSNAHLSCFLLILLILSKVFEFPGQNLQSFTSQRSSFLLPVNPVNPVKSIGLF